MRSLVESATISKLIGACVDILTPARKVSEKGKIWRMESFMALAGMGQLLARQ